MTPRRRRIERILEHRREALDSATAALAAARSRHAERLREAEAAEAVAREAEERRRALGHEASDARSLLEAAEWLSAAGNRARRAYAVALGAEREVGAAEQVVAGARLQVRQAELLAARVDGAERKIAERRERRREDEHAARIAQAWGLAGARR